jgi:hypothetical protein
VSFGASVLLEKVKPRYGRGAVSVTTDAIGGKTPDALAR